MIFIPIMKLTFFSLMVFFFKYRILFNYKTVESLWIVENLTQIVKFFTRDSTVNLFIILKVAKEPMQQLFFSSFGVKIRVVYSSCICTTEYVYKEKLHTLTGPLLVLSPSFTVTPGANSIASIWKVYKIDYTLYLCFQDTNI